MALFEIRNRVDTLVKGVQVLPEWLARKYHENDDPEDLEIDLVYSVYSDQEDDFEWRPVQV